MNHRKSNKTNGTYWKEAKFHHSKNATLPSIKTQGTSMDAMLTQILTQG
jgi:hypothetical protein